VAGNNHHTAARQMPDTNVETPWPVYRPDIPIDAFPELMRENEVKLLNSWGVIYAIGATIQMMQIFLNRYM
jgi:hypothetical protein